MPTHYKNTNTSVCLLVAVLALWLPVFADAQTQSRKLAVEIYQGKRVVAKQVLLKFRNGASRTRISSIKRSLGIVTDEGIGGAGARLYESRILKVGKLLSQLKKMPEVEYAEPNYIYHLDLAPNDQLFPQQWSLLNPSVIGADINAVPTWDLSTGSENLVVGIVDTGIDYKHLDLKNNIWTAPIAYQVMIGARTISCAAGTHGYNALMNSCDPMDDNNHGTHVAGIIGASGNNTLGVAGINWLVKMMAIKGCDADANCPDSATSNAIEFAIQVKAAFSATTRADIRVLNNSYGGPGASQTMLDEINRANAANMLFVASAGNSGSDDDQTPQYPSGFNAPNLISVAATDNADNLWISSNFGRTSVHLGAPGVQIMSTIRNNGYARFNGTSMAAPHISGAAALILSLAPLDTLALRNLLLNNIDPLPALVDKTATGGRLNLDRAFRVAVNAPYFELGVVAPSTVKPGGTANGTLNVTRRNGFTGAVSFSVRGLPAGTQANFTPTTVNPDGSTTLAISTTNATPGGNYSVTVVGRGFNLETRTIIVPFNVSDYALSATPGSPTINPGGTTQVAVSVLRQGGFPDPVSLSVSGLPPNTTATITPPVVAGVGPALLKIITASNTSPGRYTLMLNGVAGSVQRNLALQLNVADFSLTAPTATDGIRRGASALLQLQATPLGGFTGKVDFTVSGLPSGSTAVFNPPDLILATAPGNALLRVNTTTATPNGVYQLIVTASSGALQHSTTVSVLVATYTVIGIPPLPGYTASKGAAINDNGLAVGIATNEPEGLDPHQQGFVFNSTSGVTADALGFCAGGTYSTPHGINNGGIITGEADMPGEYFNAFSKTAGSTNPIKCLGSIFGSHYSIGEGITEFGIQGGTMLPVIVGVMTLANPVTYHGFVYTELGGFEDIGTIGNTGTRSFAYAINRGGQVVGASDSRTHHELSGFIYTVGMSTPPTQLADLGGESIALAINDKAHIVGRSLANQGNFSHAFLIDSAGIHDIAISLGNDIDSTAFSINLGDQVVGNYSSNVAGCSSANPCRAFYYDRGVTVDLNKLILPSSGWVLQEAKGINLGGRIIGTGKINGQVRAFVAIPEP